MALEYAPRGLVGVLTPQANTTVEPEFGILWPAGIAMINARLTSARGTIEERLVDYYDRLDDAVAQFANAPIAAVAIACTGASYLVGAQREDEIVARLEERLGVAVITSAKAVVDALRVSGARRVGFVSPYPAGLTEASVGYWRERGIEAAEVASAAPDEGAFHPIYSMRASGAREALDALGGRNLDAVVMLGTGMPTLRPILERPRLGRAPVMSCMLCLAWRTVLQVEGRSPTQESLLAWIEASDWRPRFEERCAPV
ncbi:maleate cis-trans isomerase family protein [Salinarimonas soli]|uniref:Maleate isomerase n=1 Tax=Salinarimonas soli TaxID=1638099 RepID=A0A5B2V6Q9_9HYPH|nr:aspartate/glutamate racemase family protein [Salinarimonas soli]KAA2235213.1 hypothetical protein F0L46_20940 [Salinarimonas soli]